MGKNLVTKIKKILRPNVLNFETLGIMTESYAYAYRDDGIVNDIQEHLRKLLCDRDPSELLELLNNISSSYEYDININNINGMVVHGTSDFCTKYRISFVRGCSPNLNILNRAHEETHVLHEIGKLCFLQDRIQEQIPEFLFGGLSNYGSCGFPEREYVAGIGSSYALTREKISLSLGKAYSGHPTSMKAFSDYQKMLDGKKVKIII